MITPPPPLGDINAWLLWIVQSVQEVNAVAEDIYKDGKCPLTSHQNTVEQLHTFIIWRKT